MDRNELAAWFGRLSNCRDVVPTGVTIQGVEYEACWYVDDAHGPERRLYVLGELPRCYARRNRTCFRFPGSGVMIDNVTLVAVETIRPEIEGVEGLEERLRAACREAHHLWLTGDESTRLRAALTATMLETTDVDELSRLEASCQALWQANAALLSFASSVAPGPIDLPEDMVPIMTIWRETGREKS